MKYKHALFLNPYIEDKSTSVMGLFPPIGIEYVATSAKNSVDKLTLVDLRYEKRLCDINNLLKFVREQGIDIICVSITWNRQFEEICDFLKGFPKDIPLIVGGYKATEQVETLFKVCPNISIVVRGEGEDTIQEILKDTPAQDILGISYRKNGQVVHNENRQLRPADEITTPDRSLRRYNYTLNLNNVPLTRLTFDTVLSARGCPFNCKFCTFSLNPLGQKRNYSARRVESVIEELKNTNADIILFSDDNFFVDPKRSKQLCDAIIENNIKKRFIAQARIEIAKDPILLQKMVDAGFKMLLLGIESPHDKILAQFDKGFTSEMVRKYFTELKKYPLYYHGYFIYGNIGETEEEMLYIPEFAKEIALDSITFHKLRIEKFSPLKELAEKTPGYHVTSRGEIYSDAYSHKTLKKIARKIKFSYYTPFKLLTILRKFIAIKFFTFKEVAFLLAVSPWLLVNIIKREFQKKRMLNSLSNIFLKRQ
ncbi:MAG: B12-binding domain-containing radical SAM protein [Candidatus Omnitrophica bacterium]|nr:B12-binding domain-containing radical SAM protein [Candidatus Omnitrophota bacterium]MBU1924400.1 B12-binding domain-containing radical SAM protein [Candidatus Omnitrophota bacterium]